MHPKLVHPRLTTHPLTGAPIVPIGYRGDGRPIWPILGGAPDGDDKPDGGGSGGGADEPGGKPYDKPEAGKNGDGNDKPGGKPDGKADDAGADKGAGGKDALKADLARERDKRQKLEQSIADMKDGFAKALGLKPEETSDTEELAKSLSDLKERLDKSDRQTQLLTIATEYGIGKDDIHMLTASDEAGLKKQAEWIKSKTATDDTVTGRGGRRPKPDNSQGGSNGGDTGPKSVADVMAERRAARESKAKSTTST